MIDVHCHIFSFKNVPDSFFPVIFTKRDKNGDEVLLPYIPIIKETNIYDRFSKFFDIGNSSYENILDGFFRYYSKNSIITPLLIDWTYGLKGEIKEDFYSQFASLANLKMSHPNVVKPFLGIDPRRDEILELVKKHVGSTKEFYGVKLYPPMGFLPSDPKLMPIYEYCEANSIPITTHCSSTGIASSYKKFHIEGFRFIDNVEKLFKEDIKFRFTSESVGYFCSPSNWKVVLNKFPNLYLNLAHFGGENEWKKYMNNDKNTWVDKIINLILKYPNVYTDISYTFTYRQFFPMLKKMMSSPLKNKILYGSDFYVSVIEGQFYSFLNNLLIDFSEGELELMAVKNPSNFLKMENLPSFKFNEIFKFMN